MRNTASFENVPQPLLVHGYWLAEAVFYYGMIKFILAEKQAMTQKYAPNGAVIPVTKVVAGPCVVTQIKNIADDGYCAVQVGFGTKRVLAKPQQGHLKKLGSFRYLREFRVNLEQAEKLKVGDQITASTFALGDTVQVSGISKGKGFQGVVKRHGFHGSPKSHGHKDQLRMPGSIGAGGPQHVMKGKRMGGHMGDQQVTVKNLEIVAIDEPSNFLYIKGAVPGAIGNLVLISGEGELTIQHAAAASTPEAQAQPTIVTTAEQTPAPAAEQSTEFKA